MKHLFKFLFYRCLCSFLLFIRADRLLRSISAHKRLIIMYHGIIRDKTASSSARHLSVDEFEKQLIYFRNSFNVIPLAELCEMKLKGIHPRRHTIALTFDDGFLNQVSNALPLLEKYQIPATFFISAVSLDSPAYIHPSDYLDLINLHIDDTVEINGKTFSKGKHHLRSAKNGESIYQFINTLDFPLLKKTLSDLAERFPYMMITRSVNEEIYKLITASDLSPIIKSDLTSVGAHGYLHVNFSVLNEEQIAEQLRASDDIFRVHACNSVESLAFPYGYFNEQVLNMCRQWGYKYLIAGGSVPTEYMNRVFPRIGILNLAGFAYNILSVNRGFNRFGF